MMQYAAQGQRNLGLWVLLWWHLFAAVAMTSSRTLKHASIGLLAAVQICNLYFLGHSYRQL
jgi:hypothetical protein